MVDDRYIEKLFLYLLGFSLLLHAAVFAIILVTPQERSKFRDEPYMVELQDIPAPTVEQQGQEEKTRRLAEERRRVERERAPRGEMERDSGRRIPAPVRPYQAEQPQLQRPGETGAVPVRPVPGGENLHRPKEQKLPELAKLYPSPGRMARLEESYRKRYGAEVEEGETKFLNTDDILFGSFLRRFEMAVYGVWRYPSEAAQLGLEGVTPARITFNRKGEIERVELLESSGSRILDEEVLRTLRLIGPVGGFPKGYEKDKFNLIAFFQYGITRGVSRSLH